MRFSTTPMFSAKIAGGFIVLRRDFIDKHPEAAKVFVEQSERALDYARENPEETKKIFAKALAERGENPDIAQFFRGYGVRPGGKAVERDLQFWIDVLVREGKLKEGQLSANQLLYSGETASKLTMALAQSNSVRGEVTIRHLSKTFTLNGQPLPVLKDLNLTIRSGESLAIVGASGSGKTTLLRILAGLEDADSGDVLIDGRRIRGVGTERAVIFQEPRLLPWLTVIDNISFGLETRGLSREEARFISQRYVDLVGLKGFETAYPRQLSGGMAQRVGIARALAVQPEILLLDETAGCAGCHDQDRHAAGTRPDLERGGRDDCARHPRSRGSDFPCRPHPDPASREGRGAPADRHRLAPAPRSQCACIRAPARGTARAVWIALKWVG